LDIDAATRLLTSMPAPSPPVEEFDCEPATSDEPMLDVLLINLPVTRPKETARKISIA
jgi:hypothetical protein